ncbi:Zinc finger and BTB domain-containing protein 8B [Branchiostoma belcheri]|nr:Zinc finger and BTB domain-containing protein 8B [Branchiostoma belcheri]
MTGAGENPPGCGGTVEIPRCLGQLAKVPVDKTKMTSYKEYIIELPNQGTALLHHLNEQRLNGKFCDITVMIHGRKFPAHRAVLSASSGYFHAMLDIDNDRHTIIVQDISAGAFQDLLDFMYSAKLRVSACSIVEIILTASYLQMVDVVSACSYIIRPVFGSNLPIGHFPHAGYGTGTVEAAAHGCDCSKSGSPSLPTPHHPEIRIQPHVLAKASEGFQEKVDSLEVLEKLRLEQKYHGAGKDQGIEEGKKSPLPVDIHEVYNQGGKKNKITMIHIPGMEQGGVHSFHGMPHLVPPGLRIREADSHFSAHDILQGRADGPEGILDLRVRPKRSGEMVDGRSSPEEVRVWSAPSSFNTEKGPILKMTMDRNSQDWKNMGMAEKIAAQYHNSVPTPPIERNKVKIVRQTSLDVPEKDNTDSEKAQDVQPPKGKWGWKAKRQESEESSVHPKKRICLDWDARSRHSSTSENLSRQSSFDLDDGATSVKSEKDTYSREKNCMAEKCDTPMPKKREEEDHPKAPRSPNEGMKIKQEQKVVEKAQPNVAIPNGVGLNKMEDMRQHSPPEYADRQNGMAAFPNLPPTGMMPFSAFLASRAGVLTPHPNGAATIEEVPYNYPPDMMRGAVEKEAPPGWRGPGFVPWAGKRGRGRGRRGRGMQCRTYAEKMMHLRANAELDEVFGVTEGFPSLLGNKEHSKALGSPARFMNGNLSDSDSSKDGSEGKVPKNRASPGGSSDEVSSLSTELTRKRRKYTTEFKWEVNQKLTADGIDIASLSAETILSSGEDRPRQRPWKRVQLPCPICGARFPKVEQLQEHLVEHKGDKYSLYLSNWM